MPPGKPRNSAPDALSSLAEFFLIAAILIGPWLFGADEAGYHVVLLGLVGISLFCLILRVFIHQSIQLTLDAPIWLFGGLVLLGLFQILPLPEIVLSWISPETGSLRLSLLPNEPDTLAGKPFGTTTPSTISLNPFATKQSVYQILSLAMIYLCTKLCIKNIEQISRICWCLFANGSLLAFQGITQSFTSNSDMIYWSFPTTGTAFGPMNRDHFPDYMNLCIGSSCALLTAVYHQSLPPMRNKGPRPWNRVMGPLFEALNSPMQLLQSPANLWVLFGLIFMLASVPMTGSRGGFAAMCVGLLVAGGLASQNLKKKGLPGYILWLIPLVVIFFTFVGWSFLESRVVKESGIASLQKEGRWFLWGPLFDLIAKFPVFGTGFGSFILVEHLVRKENLAGLTVDYAHNEYLEAIVEGGLIRLIITLIFVLIIIRSTILAMKNYKDDSHALIPAGICWGLMALAVHSFLDFGIHLPSVAFPAAVMLGLLVWLRENPPVVRVSQRDLELAKQEGSNAQLDLNPLENPDPDKTLEQIGLPRNNPGQSNRRRHSSRGKKQAVESNSLNGISARIAALGLGLIMINLIGQSIFYARIESLMVSSRTARAKGDFAKEEARLSEALNLAPFNPLIHEAIGISRVISLNDDQKSQRAADELIDEWVATDVLVFTGHGFFRQMGLQPGLIAFGLMGKRTQELKQKIDANRKEHFLQAVQSLETARNLCPILYRVHAYLALLAPRKDTESGSLQSQFKTDIPSVHLARALTCFPVDSEIRYSAGIASLNDGDRDTAATHFQVSIQNSKNRLADIINISRAHYNIKDLVRFVLPEDPVVLSQALATAFAKAPNSDRAQVLVRAMELIMEGRGRPDSLMVKTLLAEMEALSVPPISRLDFLKSVPEAILSETPLRLEIAFILEDAGLYNESARELAAVRLADPRNPRASELEEILKRDLILAPWLK